MTTKSENPNSGNYNKEGVFSSSGKGRQTILPAERWLLITEKAYHRVQRRGFVGGDPFDDWAEAEREVDAIYETDPGSIFLQADAEKLTEKVKSTFGGYGLGHLSLDAILEQYRDGLDVLTEHNRKLIDSTSELAIQQTALFQDAVGDALETLRLFSQGKLTTDGFEKQAELSKRAMENALSYFKELTESATEITPLDKKGQGGR